MAAMPSGAYRKHRLHLFAACNKSGDGMLQSTDPTHEPENNRHSSGWRGVVSAWAVVLLLAMLFVGAQAVASHRAAAPSRAKHAGAVIPRHDPASAGVGIPCATPLEACGKSATALVPGVPYPYPVW